MFQFSALVSSYLVSAENFYFGAPLEYTVPVIMQDWFAMSLDFFFLKTI